MPRVQENAPGILPSRSISLGSRMSTITTLPSFAILIASAALIVSISVLASSIMALIPRRMVWAICASLCVDVTGLTTSLKILAMLAHQFLHRAFQPLNGDRIHALREDAANDGGRFRIVPVPLRHRIEPHRMRIGADDTFEPDRARLLVDMFDRTARYHDLVRRHRGVADEHRLVVVRVFVQHVPSRRAVGETPPVLLPHAF